LNEIEAEAHNTEDHRRESAQRARDEKKAFLIFFANSYDRVITVQSEMK